MKTNDPWGDDPERCKDPAYLQWLKEVWHVEIHEQVRHLWPGQWTISGHWEDEKTLYKKYEKEWEKRRQEAWDKKHPDPAADDAASLQALANGDLFSTAGDDIHYYTTIAQYELMECLQNAVKRGWTFTFDHGERKFQSNHAVATKGEHVVNDYGGLNEMFNKITQIDFPEPDWSEPAPKKERVHGADPSDALACDWCKEIKYTTVNEVWCEADPTGRLVRMCQNCSESCAG